MSGNPAGRPRGSRNESRKLLDAMVDADGALMVGKLVQLAKEGVPFALKFVADRLLRRERHVHIELPRVATAADVGAAVADVIALAADGELSIEEATAFMRLLDQQRRAIETSELAERLDKIEAERKEWD